MMRRTWIAALVCVAALLAHSQDLPPADRLLFADGLYSRGLYEMAAKEYRSFIETATPDESLLMSARFRLGECLRQTGDVRGADREYAAVFNGPPDGEFRFRAGYRRAEVFAEVGHDAAASDLYKAVLDAGAKGAIASAAAYQRGLLLLKAGAVADGVGALRHAAELAPESETAVYALLKLGELHADAKAEAKGDGAALAIGFYDRAAGLTSAPPRAAAEALFQSGDLSFRRSDHSRAAETMSKLLKRYPEDARAGDARFRLAWAEYHRGRFGAALAAAAAGAEEEGGRRADWLYLRANCQRQLAKADEAVATYRELLAKHAGGGREGLVRYEMALVEYRRGRFREALDALAPAKVPPEQEKEALWIKADSHAGIGETDSAVECYRALVREFPDSDMAPHAMYRLAHYFQSKSRHAEAAGQYRELADRFPKHELADKALFACGVSLELAGRDSDAVAAWTGLLDGYPKSALVEESMYRKAMGELRLKRGGQAEETLRGAMKLFPGGKFAGDVAFWLGIRAMERGNGAPEAEAMFRRALEIKPEGELADEARFRLALALRKLGREAEAGDIL
ncbi:MAG: tetratricopeptide repeat protein, partial [Lentisphaerae bacterium]|nr:tetratricopeptide repeat protein [Lentisphaerota bacterium]